MSVVLPGGITIEEVVEVVLRSEARNVLPEAIVAASARAAQARQRHLHEDPWGV
jgi:pyrroline-5-carboxylate reductase